MFVGKKAVSRHGENHSSCLWATLTSKRTYNQQLYPKDEFRRVKGEYALRVRQGKRQNGFSIIVDELVGKD
jgi:hypothetical protein